MNLSPKNSSYLYSESNINNLNDAFIDPSSTGSHNDLVGFTAPQIRNPSGGNELQRRIIIYSKESKLGYDKKLKIKFNFIGDKIFWEKFPQNNILQKIKKGDGISLIINEIIKISTGVEIPAVDENTLNNCILINVLEKLRKNWRKFNIRYYLEKECPSENESDVKTWKDLIDGSCYYERTFLIDAISAATVLTTENSPVNSNILESEVPYDITIDKDSPFSKAQKWKCVYRFLLSVINFVIPLELFGSSHNKTCFKKAVKKFVTCGKYDVILLESLMFGVKVSQCRWTKNFKTFTLKSKALAQVWIWLLKTFVIETLKSFFYITEGNKCKNQLFFFRKRTFQGMRDSYYKKLLQLGSIIEIKRQQYKVLIELYGKSNHQNLASIRFIPKSSGLRAILPIKKGILSDEEIIHARQLIKFITDKFFPDIKTIRSDKDFHQCLIKYIESLGQASTFVVKVDISDAFGSVEHDLLFNILADVEKDLPGLVKFDQFAIQNKNSKKPLFIPSGRENNSPETVYNDRKNLIKIGTFEVNVKKTFENIKRMVNTQFFQIGVRQRFLIVKGIAQGGSLSSALCDLYYSAMCHKYLRNFTGKERIMMRSVDDFLYITSRKTEAKNFLRFMEQGIDEFNCHINLAKTMHNLDNECRIPYRGTVFCPASNQILVSVFSLSSCPPRYSIRLNRSSNSGTFTILKLKQILKSRFTKLISHPTSTSISALVANIWRMGLIIGARIPCLIKVLLLPERNFNSKFLAKNVQSLGKIMWSKLKSRWKDAGRSFTLSKQFCITVFMAAIYLVLKNGKRQPPLQDLKKNIRKRFTNLLTEISEHERKCLPRLTLK